MTVCEDVQMRNKRLDILRCVAVVMVILVHSGESRFFSRVGWTGVDLFFVLSGFLISGLLFSEYKKRHAINYKRFFIRRGLKIYPAFYTFLLITGIAGQLVFHTHPTFVQYLHEVFFIMNYRQRFWDHTWTLAGGGAILYLPAHFSFNHCAIFRQARRSLPHNSLGGCVHRGLLRGLSSRLRTYRDAKLSYGSRRVP
jgi:peptidoglycan/LPS O-acetylase OafA/YrhL